LKVTICLLFVFGTFNLSLAQTSGLSFLKIGVGGRATGMAEAFTAVTDDATATYWNPAGLMQVRGNHLSLTHNEWFEDIRSEFVAFALPKNTYALGFSLNSTNVSGIELRSNLPNVQPISTFDAHDLSLGISYARMLNPNITLGVTLKYIYEKIYIEETSGLAGDFGFIYTFNPVPVQVGAVVQNIGFMSKFKRESPSLPQVFRLGMAYKPPKKLLNGSWILASDWVVDNDAHSHLNLGIEYRVQKFLAIRLGYQTGFEMKQYHFGFGLVSGRLLLDYGYVPLTQNFGQGHRITFGMKL
jgi:long-subunit fatty acid transport protein